MKKPEGLRWLHMYRDRLGRVRFYLRRKGRPNIPIEGRPGTAKFSESYANALRASDAQPLPTSRGEMPSGPHVYFVRSGDFIKIGYSEKPGERLVALQTGSAVTLEVLLFIPGDISLERRLHGKFKSLRASGEWFAAAPSLLDFVASERTKQEQPLASQIED